MNEKENTFRALKEQPLLVTSILCMFGLHRWEKWSRAYRPKERDSRHVQHRHCACCNKMAVRNIRVPNWVY